MLLIETPAREVLLEKRPPGGIWGGLWSFPECSDDAEIEQVLDRLAGNIQRADPVQMPKVNHGFTHYKLQIQPVHVRLRGHPGAIAATQMNWFSLKEPFAVGLARPVARLLQLLQDEP